MCDFIWLGKHAEEDRVVAIELKSGSFRVSQVVEQLQQGADQARQWLSGYGGSKVTFRPIFAHGGKGDKKGRQDLREKAANRIRFRKRSYEIKIVRCGSSLEDAF